MAKKSRKRSTGEPGGGPDSQASASKAAKAQVTIYDVAKEAGYSIGTVSDIANRGLAHKYTATTRERVTAAMDRLGYRPIRAAQVLSKGCSDLVGVAMTRGFDDPYHARLFHLIQNALEEYGLSSELRVIPARNPREARKGMEWLLGRGVDALIVGPLYYWDEHILDSLRGLGSKRCPILTFGAVHNETDMHHVLFEDDGCGRIGVEYLISKGHQRIAYLGAYPDTVSQTGRGTVQRGVEQSLESNGLLDKAWFIERAASSHFKMSREVAEAFASRWLSTDRSERPTAVICKNDQLASIALLVFHEFGIRVPEDLSVMGFDNSPESEFTIPPLSTIDNAIGARVQSIAVTLSKVLNLKALKPQQAPVITPRVVVRRSVSPAESGAPV